MQSSFLRPTCPFSCGLCCHLLVCTGLTPFDSLHTWLAVSVGSFYSSVWRHLKCSYFKICVHRSWRGHSSQLPSWVHQWTSGFLCWKTLLIISHSVLLMISTSPNIHVCRPYCFTEPSVHKLLKLKHILPFTVDLFVSTGFMSIAPFKMEAHSALYQHITKYVKFLFKAKFLSSVC